MWILLFLLVFVFAPWIFVVSSQKAEYQFSLLGHYQGRLGRFLDIISGLLTLSGVTLQMYLIDKFIFPLLDIHLIFLLLVIPVYLYILYSALLGLSYCIRSIIRLIKGS
jgi:hypothetical protein